MHINKIRICIPFTHSVSSPSFLSIHSHSYVHSYQHQCLFCLRLVITIGQIKKKMNELFRYYIICSVYAYVSVVLLYRTSMNGFRWMTLLHFKWIFIQKLHAYINCIALKYAYLVIHGIYLCIRIKIFKIFHSLDWIYW